MADSRPSEEEIVPAGPARQMQQAAAEMPDSLDSEKGELSPVASYGASGVPSDTGAVPATSRGVRQMDALRARLSIRYRILVYNSLALLIYVMSLDRVTSPSYLASATSFSFHAHSALATINAIQAVFQAVSQPPIAKLADGFGRVETYAFCVALYVLGYVIVAASPTVYVYAIGTAVNTVGTTGLSLLQFIVVADISSPRNRLFWTIFPSVPSCINLWVSGNVVGSILGSYNQHAQLWRWGVGMFTIIVPFCAIPILLTLGIGMRKTRAQVHAERQGAATESKRTLANRTSSLSWQLDVVGLFLLVVGFGMVLTIVTVAKSNHSHWNDPHTIALLAVGGFLIVCFFVWERFGARSPLVPLHLLKSRTVAAAFVIAIANPASGGVVAGYFYTFVLVVTGQTTLSAKRITSSTGFVSLLTTAVMGVLVRYIRVLKPIVVFGFVTLTLSFGLMIKYRTLGASVAQIVGVQILHGIGLGCIQLPVQTAIQAVTPRNHIGTITAGYWTTYYISHGIGLAIGGGMWSNTVPAKLHELISDPALAARAYTNPLGVIRKHPLGTPVREALRKAQSDATRILTITATFLAAIGLVASFFIEWTRLPDEQSSSEADAASETGTAKKLAKAG